MVQDPNFWRRFSLAVHQDDLHKDSPDLKHSYVPPSSAPLSPTSQHALLSPACSMAQLSVPSPATLPLRREQIWQSEFEAEKAAAARSSAPRKLQKSASRASRRPLLHKRTSSSFSNATFAFPAESHSKHTTINIYTSTSTPLSPMRPPSALSFLRNPSTLSLSGRRGTVFKTWTEITANPPNSDSWLAGQNKKAKQRAWICWCFWLGVIVLVAGVVTAVLVLKAHGII